MAAHRRRATGRSSLPVPDPLTGSPGTASAPGRGALVYVGYSDDRTTEDFIDLTQKDRTLFVKFGYAWVM